MTENIISGMWRMHIEIFQNPLYWAAILCSYVVYRRKAPDQSIRLTVLSALQGWLIGSIATGVILGIGVYIQQRELLIGLLPLSLILSRIRTRWICYAYSTAILAIVLYGIGMMNGETAAGLLCMVGVLHMAEAVLCLRVQEEERIWPLSLGVLIEESSGLPSMMPKWWPLLGDASFLSILPLTAMLAYQCPKQYASRAACAIFVYGLLILGLGVLSSRMEWMLMPAFILQVSIHEWITNKP